MTLFRHCMPIIRLYVDPIEHYFQFQMLITFKIHFVSAHQYLKIVCTYIIRLYVGPIEHYFQFQMLITFKIHFVSAHQYLKIVCTYIKLTYLR